MVTPSESAVQKDKCELCGYSDHKGSLQIHHKDRNHKNNNLDNLQVLCANCHFKIHHAIKRSPNGSPKERIKPYKNISDQKLLSELIEQGYKLYHNEKDKSKWFLIKGSDSFYVLASVRKQAPELFGEKPILSDKLLPGHPESDDVNDDENTKLEALIPIIPDTPVSEKSIVEQPKPEYPQPSPDHSRAAPTSHDLPAQTPGTALEPTKAKEIAQIAVRQPEPGNYIAPSEFILHETPRRILESIWFQEGLHTVEKEKRHELAFARIELDGKGKPILVDDAPSAKGGKETLFSLADLAVYRLAETYTKWKKLEPDVIAMKEKIIGLSIANEWMACEIENLRNEKNMLMQSAFLVSLQRRR